MSELVSLAKWIGAPGSAGFFVLCSAVSLALAWASARGRQAAKVGMVLLVLAYVLAAIPSLSDATVARLPPYGPLWSPGDARPGDLLVVLSGDNAWGRAVETRRVLDASAPRCVLVSGSRWFVRLVVEAGVARDRLIADDTTNTTREQIAKLASWAEQCGADRVVVIASTLSMPRVAALIRAAGVPAVLAASPVDDAPASSGIGVHLPSLRALRVTRDAVYEHVAIAYYKHRGWIG